MIGYVDILIDDEQSDNEYLHGEDLVVLDDEYNILSDHNTIFILCNRCEKKGHFGTLINNIFICGFVDPNIVANNIDIEKIEEYIDLQYPK